MLTFATVEDIALAKVRYYMVTTKLITNKFVVKMVILGFLTKKRRHPKMDAIS